MNYLKRAIKPSVHRFCSTRCPTNVLERLRNRKLIRVAGPETSDLLQGLVTNDIRHLDPGMGCLYAMFLNTRGRVLYDTLIYKVQVENTFLIECDSVAVEPLKKQLRTYRVRRKIDVDSFHYDVYAIFNPVSPHDIDHAVHARADGVVDPSDMLDPTKSDNKSGTKVIGNLLMYRDPRVPTLGLRVIAPGGCDVQTELAKTMTVTAQSKINYRNFRYRLGIGEGVEDLPPNECFPLEANCDYLHGVSFHKGCYIGQEVTARTHHTGVVRKRLMPLVFQKAPNETPADNKILVNDVNLGKLRGIEGDAGLALLRIAQAIELENIQVGNAIGVTAKPGWWPLEAPKEKMTA